MFNLIQKECKYNVKLKSNMSYKSYQIAEQTDKSLYPKIKCRMNQTLRAASFWTLNGWNPERLWPIRNRVQIEKYIIENGRKQQR